MKKQAIAFLLGLFTSLAAFAQVDCAALNEAAERSGVVAPDAGSERDIVGKERVQFYSAPDQRCKISGLFVIPGDVLFPQIEYKGFTKAAFIPTRKTDKEVLAWVLSSRLKKSDKDSVPQPSQ